MQFRLVDDRNTQKLLAGLLVVFENCEHQLKRIADELAVLNRPHLTRIGIRVQGENMADALTLTVGDKKTDVVQGFDQFGNPFAIDFTQTPAAWSVDNPAIVSSTPSADGDSDPIAALAAGTATVSVAVAGFSDSQAITVTAPAPVLTSVKIVAQ